MNDKLGPRIRVAIGSVPKDGGTYTFYRNLRPALLHHNIDLRCVSAGIEQRDLWDDEYADEGCTLIAPGTHSLKSQARAFVDWCGEEEIDIVMGINSAAILSAIPHLPKRVRVMSRCANAFDHGYKITMSGGERLARIVALSPRLSRDLLANYGADPEKLVLIPNGIDPEPFQEAAARPRGKSTLLELGFLGRLEHNQKGVMHLPEIVAGLRHQGVPFRLRIAGKGRDGGKLRAALREEEAHGTVEFLGSLKPNRIPEFLGSIDIFVFTSYFEGIPNALLEAMMAGCVPVCFQIPGITDFVIDEGCSGLLCEVGDAKKLASTIAALSLDRARIDAMHVAASRTARERFTSSICANAYAAEFRGVMAKPALTIVRRRWRDFKPDPNFQYGWRKFIPKSAKTSARMLLNRLQYLSHGSRK